MRRSSFPAIGGPEKWAAMSPDSSGAFWRGRQAGARILEQRLMLYTIAVKRICRPAFASPRHRMRRRP